MRGLEVSRESVRKAR